MDRQTSLVARGIIPEDSYTRERDRIQREQQKVTADLAALDQRTEEEEARPADFLPIIRGLLDRWDMTPVETRRAMLRSLLRGVYVYPAATAPDGSKRPAYAVPVAVWEDPPALLGHRATTQPQLRRRAFFPLRVEQCREGRTLVVCHAATPSQMV